MSRLALVTGASGFIGLHVCNYLLENGYSVRIFLRSQFDVSAISNSSKVEIIQGSFEQSDKLRQACEHVDVAFHLAGIAHVNANISDYRRANIGTSQALLDACIAVGCPRLVFFSSVLAAQAGKDGASVYASSKKQAEELFLRAANDQFHPVILRPVNVYGPGMKGNIAGLISRIQRGALPPLPRLENQLSLVSVQDLCAAALLAAEIPAAGGQIYPVTDGEAYTPNTLESAIYAALGRKKPGWHSPRMLFYAASLAAQMLNGIGLWNNDLGLRTYRNLVESNQASCEKITTELGYRPTRNFADELPAILAAM